MTTLTDKSDTEITSKAGELIKGELPNLESKKEPI